MYQRKNQVDELKICLIDCVGVVASFFIAGLIRFHGLELFSASTNLDITLIGILLIHIIIFYVLRVYEGLYRRGIWREFNKVLKYNIILFMGVTAYTFVAKNSFSLSRATLIYFSICNQFIIFFLHRLIQFIAGNAAINEGSASKLLLITEYDKAVSAIHSLLAPSEWKINLTGIVTIDQDLAGQFIEGIPVVANRNTVYEYAVKDVVDEVFICVKDIRTEENFYKKLILELENMGIVVNVSVPMLDLGAESAKRIYRLGDYYVAAFVTRLYDYRLMLLKRLMDIIGALFGLLITAIVTIFIGPAIKLESPGPLFFKQTRIGKNGRPFTFYKFRSMYADAEEQKAKLQQYNEMHGLMFKMANDPRVTRVGRFIRKTSLDELPQFWNVLKGDMSLVGTRPPTQDEYLQYEGWQKRRISFRPGITGLWQISGRSNIKDFDEVVRLDLEYIDNWSLGLDIKIILKTVLAVFRGIGAR